MAVQIVPPSANLDHQALDRILSRLEARFGHDPRVGRGLNLFLAGRFELFPEEPTTGIVHGESGKSYHASATIRFCECPDASANGNACKHQICLMIAVQMRAVEQSKERGNSDLLAYYQQLCQEQQRRGQLLIRNGVRPVDNQTWREVDELVQRVKAQLPTLVIR